MKTKQKSQQQGIHAKRLCLVLGLLLFAPVQAADVVLDEITAIVNEGVVLRSEVAAETRFLTQQARAAGQQLPTGDVLKERVLERLISQEIQRQRAKRLGIEVDQASVNDAIDQVAAGNQLKTIEFRQALQKQGIDYNYYRDSIKHEILLSRLIQREVDQTINISEQEINDYIAGNSSSESETLVYRLRHILIAVAESETADKISAAKQTINDIKRRLETGDDFAAVAAAQSNGRLALQGGDLGWRKLNELPVFLREAVETATVGSISDPVQSPDGFHIIKVEDKQTRTAEIVTESRVRHIFIANKDTESAQQKLTELRNRLTQGESFATLASEHSQDPSSSNAGGELPWAVAGDLPAEMQKQADSLALNTLSQPFQTRLGWHILEVLERREARASDTKLRREAELNLRQRKVEQETQRWSRRLRDEAFVEVKS